MGFGAAVCKCVHLRAFTYVHVHSHTDVVFSHNSTKQCTPIYIGWVVEWAVLTKAKQQSFAEVCGSLWKYCLAGADRCL